MDTPKSHHVVKRLIAPLTVFALTKLLESRRVKGALQDVDSRTYVTKKKAARAMRSRAKTAAKRPAWLAAGAAAFVVGIGLVARAAKK